MNISLCITVLNEEYSINALLSSIFAGTKKPNEIVLVDGGSSDNTLSQITDFKLKVANKYPDVKFKIVKQKQSGIAVGRNLAIKHSVGNIIVQTDAGCVVKKDWLQKITQPFKDNKIDIVAGFYEMPSAGPLELVLNVFQGVPPERFDRKNFIPSARSVAFRKPVWKKVGGYDESLKTAGEDTLFFHKAQKLNLKMERVGKARVIWEEVRNVTFQKSLGKFFNYAKADAQSGIWWNPTKKLMSHNIKVLLIFIRYLIFGFIGAICLYSGSTPLFLLLLLILIIYLIYPIYKWYDVVKSFSGRIWLIVVQICSDFAVMSGFASGILKLDGSFKRHIKRN